MIAVVEEKPTAKRGRPRGGKKQRSATGKRPPIELAAIYDRKHGAVVIDCSEMTLLRAWQAGHLQGYQIGRHVKHSGQQLLDWLESGGKTGHGSKPKEEGEK